MDGVNPVSSFLTAHAARAYAGQAKRPAGAPQAVAPSQPIARADASDRRPDASGSHALSAGRVPGGVGFDAVVGEDADERSLALYTRAADVSEAATRIQLGRVLDVEG